MQEFRKVEFPEKDQPLRDDVSMLGQMLGEVLVEQHGPELLEQVESVRRAAILAREGEQESVELPEQILSGPDTGQLKLIIKAFSSYLRLANLAEKVHRIRRNRTYMKQGGASQRGSLDAACSALARAGVTGEDMARALDRLQIQPVFTAHPTEAARRSILQKEYSIIHRMVERLNPDLTPHEEGMARARIRDAVTSGWQTRAVSQARPTVADELDNVLFYLTEVLYRVVPPYREALREALDKHYGEAVPTELGDQLLRFGSWVGGDMDGNPNVNSATIIHTLETQRNAIIARYLPEVKQLARYLSQTRGEIGINERLEQRLREYSDARPEWADRIPARHRQMPYRCLLQMMAGRLEAAQHQAAFAYETPLQFRDDLELIAESLADNLGEHAGLFSVRRLLMRARTFGFHLATLDVRQDAELHRAVLGELLGIADWLEWNVPQRMAHLETLLSGAPLPDIPPGLSEQAAETLRVFQAIGSGRSRFGDAAAGLFIVSMTQGADDVLTVLALARFAGLGRLGDTPLDVVPLLETVDDLDAGPHILGALLDSQVYRAHLERRHKRQVIMVGYSDSNKDSGIVAARWGLQQAQYRLARLGSEAGVEVSFFHGRGGTVSRGGGHLVNGIAGAPAGTIGGYLRVTEQGEVINQKYGMRPIALRNLELVTTAVLQHGLSDVGQHPDTGMRTLLGAMAANARSKYRSLVHDHPDFVSFFRAATPIDVIERLAIGSRPASRRSGDGIENLRAIPWVFSWAQIRVGLPGVYGMGTALDLAARENGMDRLREIYRRWSFFRGMVDDVEMVLAKSELGIGRRYAQLAEPGLQPVFNLVRAEFDLATERILELKGSSTLLEDQETLRRTIRLRNPYVDPMHIVQIDLLRRWRSGGREDDELLDALKATVNGIALGIQNTG